MTRFIDVKRISSVKDVLDELHRLGKMLDKMQLRQFKLFNSAYYVVTDTIHSAIHDDYFDNPDLVEKSIVIFASFYFDAVNDAANKNPNLSQPWAMLDRPAKPKPAPAFIALLLGASAHINYDLPYALQALMGQESTEDPPADIVKIDKLLMLSGKQIIGMFEEQDTRLNFLKRRFVFLYYRPVMYMILYWRIRAWKNYRKMKGKSADEARITSTSLTAANRILKLSNILT